MPRPALKTFPLRVVCDLHILVVMTQQQLAVHSYICICRLYIRGNVDVEVWACIGVKSANKLPIWRWYDRSSKKMRGGVGRGGV